MILAECRKLESIIFNLREHIENKKLKSEKCKFWESKDEFLGQFNLDLVDDEAAEEEN